MLLPWLLCGLLALVVLVLCIRLRLLHRSLDALCADLADRLSQDTNVLLSVASRDRHLRRLASELSGQLRLLRSQRRRYLSGDRELREAVTNLSHDLRTPLTAVCGYLELLEREEKSAAAARYLALVSERTQAMKQLTEELFRYSVVASSGEAMRLEPTNLRAALEESVAGFYAALTARGIVPVVRMTRRQIVRRANPAALSRVFGNILSNALKYSDGDLEIALRDDGSIRFTNGASGLDEVQVGRLFDRFFSVEAASNSTGLGLSIARTLVEQMDGSITARYEDRRLTICVTLPE